jgi:hypothetical protein
MIRQHSRRSRAAATTIGAAFSLLLASSSPAFAEYRAWFAPWDYVGDFQPGDVSEDYTEMIPPPSACGLRITDPGYYRWTDDVGGTVSSDDLYKDVIIWIDNPGAGCSRSFSVRYSDDSVTFAPPQAGAVSIEISTNYGAHWVTDTGYYLYTCSGCVGADDLTVPPQDHWSLPAASALTDVSGSILDVRRQFRVAGAIANLSRHLAQLQIFLQARIADRRRAPLGGLEGPVRNLEDAAAQKLAAARASADTCETLARRAAFTDSYVACTTAARDVEQSESLMLAAWSLSHPPSKR